MPEKLSPEMYERLLKESRERKMRAVMDTLRSAVPDIIADSIITGGSLLASLAALGSENPTSVMALTSLFSSIGVILRPLIQTENRSKNAREESIRGDYPAAYQEARSLLRIVRDVIEAWKIGVPQTGGHETDFDSKDVYDRFHKD